MRPAGCGVRTSFEDLKLHIETAAGTGARKILVVPGFLSAEEADRLGDCTDRKSVYTFMDGCPAVRSMCGALRDAVGYAGRFGIKVTLEDFDDLRSPYGLRRTYVVYGKCTGTRSYV
jgi:sugar phosphate isomerase/epimerase